MTRNHYAMWNRYGNRANGGRILHVFADKAERDRWVAEDRWHDDVGDFQREAVTFREAERVRDYICHVIAHGDVDVPERLATLCRGVWPNYPFPDRVIAS